MRCTFKTVFYVNGSKERNGIVPIMGRVTINGTIAQFSCKQSVTKAIWDAKGNRAIGKSKEAKEVNFALDNIKAQIAKHYQRLSDREAFVTAEMVRNAYQGIGTEYETLLRAFDKENAAFAKRVGKDRAKNTYNKYLVVRKYVAEFIKYQYKRSDMSMNELTEEFIRDYCLFLKKIVFLFSTSFVSTVLIIETRKNGNKRRHIDPIHRWDVDRGGSCGGEKLAGRLSRKRETVGAGLFYSSSGKSPKSHADREPGRGVVSF